MATALAPSRVHGHQAAGHTNLERVWEIVTVLIATELLIKLLGTASLEFEPVRRVLLEGTLHFEKIVVAVSPVILFLGRRWVWGSEIVLFFVAWGGPHLPGYLRLLCKRAGFAFIGLLLVCAAGEFLEWQDHGPSSPLNAKFYDVEGGTVELFKFTDPGVHLCTLSPGTRVENQRVRAGKEFGPGDLVVRAETATCAGWGMSYPEPVGVIKGIDFGRLREV